MNRETTSDFALPSALGLDPVQPGTNLLVSGPSGRGARDVAIRLALANLSDGEGALLLSADVGGRALLDRATDEIESFDPSRVGIVDCSGIEDEQQRFDEHAAPIEDPGDLMSIEMELSVLYETLVERGLERVRLGMFSVTSLLAHADLRRVSRFVHMLTGRVIATDDLGIFLVDGSMQDDQTVDAIEQYCDATIDVRSSDSGLERRVRGLLDEDSSWMPIDTSTWEESSELP